MVVYISMLRWPNHVRETLSNAGWKLDAEDGASLCASHAEVADEPAARSRLQQLGLLTSASLRIEFRPTGRAERLGRR